MTQMYMKIDRLFIKAFGGLEDFELVFTPGMQIVYGINESGKTTIQTFIKAMFYGFGKMGHSIDTNDRKKYQPWSGRTMGGYIVFTHQGLTYRLEKQFADRKSQDRTSLSLEVSGETINLKNPDQPGHELFQISETEFLNTVFVENTFVDSENLQDIDRKINRHVGLAEYDWSYDTIHARLDKARKYYKPDRGDDGYLLNLDQRIADLNIELEDALARDAEVSQLNQEIDRLEQELQDLAERERLLQLQIEQHHKLKLADSFEKYRKLEKSLEYYEQTDSQLESEILRSKSISAKELTEIANQRQQTAQAYSEYEIRYNLLEQRIAEQQNFREEAKRKISEIVEDRSRLQYLEKKSAERNPRTFKKPKISYGSFIPLVIAEVFFLIGGMVFRSSKPVLSGILIVLAVLLPFIMVFIYYFLQRRYENQIKQYHDEIRQYEIRTIKIQNGLQKLEWEVDQVEQRLQQLIASKDAAAEAADIAYGEYESQLKKLKYLIKPFFIELPNDDQLDQAIQSLREQTVDSIHTEEEINRIREEMRELKGEYEMAEFYQAYQDAQQWLIDKQSQLRTFPEFSESHIHSQLEGIQENRLSLRENLATAKTNLSHLTGELTSTIELESELQRLNEIFEKAKFNYRSLLISLKMLEHSRATFEQDIRPHLNQKAAEFLSAMTGDQYKELKIDQNYQVRLQADSKTDSEFYEQAFYSAGLNDQINLALRLALTELLQDSSGKIPLILDDPFTQLDQDRARLSLNLLQGISTEQKRQIILFTSQRSLLNLINGEIEVINI